MMFLRGICILVLMLASCTAVDSGNRIGDQRLRVRDGIKVARVAAVAVPGLSETARAGISRDEPRVASFVEFGVIVDCSYRWLIDGDREVYVRYQGDPLDGRTACSVTVQNLSRPYQ